MIVALEQGQIGGCTGTEVLSILRVFAEGGNLLGMLDHLGLLGAETLTEHVNTYPYHPKVLVLPPRQEIYRTDSERDQTFSESVAIHDHVCRWYIRCGYQAVEVPRQSLSERCAFVSEIIRQSI